MRAERGTRARLRSERGQASVELVGMLPLLLIAALLVWQLLLAGYAVTSAENAARNASRAEALGDDGREVGEDSLSYGLDEGAEVQIEGDRATVRVRIPIVVPGLSTDGLSIERDAELPSG